jgi:Zn-dependent protease with chaperone function
MSLTVNFFQKQDVSRRWSYLFGTTFALVVAAFFALTYIGFRLIFLVTFVPRHSPLPEDHWNLFSYHPTSFILSMLIFGLTVIVTAKRLLAIKNGGSTFVATTLRAVPLGNESVINTSQGKQQEKILKNIVSEMAIAASISEPDVYILPVEEGINAMAVGTDPEDTAIIISQGALRRLSRDELSGLVAHEFSHILNGDTRHFTLMAGWLHGLFFVQIIGRKLLASSRGKSIHIGILLIALGFVASLSGRIVQAAFSRNREWLADASAVQFTRDPKSLASVLKKIGGLDAGSKIKSIAMPELRHIFMAQPDRFNFLASHPPLEERIWELDPNWDGWYYDFTENPVDYLAQSPPPPKAAELNANKSLPKF